MGSISEFAGRWNESTLLYEFGGPISPNSVYSVDIEDYSTHLVRKEEFPGYDEDLFAVDSVTYLSKDGTEIPAYILRMKEVLPDVSFAPEKPIPTLIYAYGGFGMSNLDVEFSYSRIQWMQHYGGMYVQVGIRGGGEYGEEWHEEGSVENRQNSFDDLAYCAKALHDSGLTVPELTAINGGSNGGTVVAVVAMQHPDWFGAMVSDVPVTDMLRFQHFTVGAAWIDEYGSSEEGGFDYLFAYSPLHNVAPVKYPWMLVTTGDHDDRVVPLHSYKFVATLQSVAGEVPDQSPLLLKITENGGHSGSAGISAAIDDKVQLYNFLTRAMDLKW